MISSSCRDYSLSNDCHCVIIVIVIICNESMYISSCLVLPCLEWTSITIVIIGMTLYELVLHYHIISYHISCSYVLSLLLIWSPFHSILFYFISFQIHSIWFYSILLNSIYCIVQYSISYQWMICVYLSVCLSICLYE